MSDPAPAPDLPHRADPEAYTARNGRFLPSLKIHEWIIYGLLAAALAVINIYTTLLAGWGDNGSIISVLASVLVLGAIGKLPSIPTLNLGQTMASAGGAVGFSVATFAAVKIAQPEFQPDYVTMTVMFAAMGIVGCIIGASVRRYMVRYFFPTGTACAVIQRTLTEPDPVARARPLRILAWAGGLTAIFTVPTKIALTRGGEAILHNIPLGFSGLHLGIEPLLYGIGIIVGPRIGIGMLIGGVTAWVIIPEVHASSGSLIGVRDWARWGAIAMLTLPTFATIFFAYLFKHKAEVPPGFTPGATSYRMAPRSIPVYGFLAVAGVGATAACAHALFDLPFYVTILTFIVAIPLCVINGRVTGDTDINPIRLVAIVLLAAMAWMIDSGVAAMLGMAVIGGTLAGLAVDLMQDQRTGYLLDTNPHHQTSILCIGTVIGACAAVPFVALVSSSLGFGDGTALPAPSAQVWAAMAGVFAKGLPASDWLVPMLVIVSVAASGYAYLTVWPRTAKYMPSVFGMGIGLLLGFEQSAAIFVGGLIHWLVKRIYMQHAATRYLERQRGKGAKHAKDDVGAGVAAARRDGLVKASDDTMLVGSSMFAAAAVVAVLIILVTELMKRWNVDWFFMAG